MIQVDCSEMDLDEQLALASAISDGLGGKGVGIVKDAKIVVDELSKVSGSDVAKIVESFVARRGTPGYSVEADGDELVVHTPDPKARARGRKDTGELLPPNLMICPFCSFVTPYEELYNVHLRSHGFV
jgi:hypothetical protein